MSLALSVPADLVRLQALLSDHPGLEPMVDAENPSVEIWVVEQDGELRRWILVGVGERTVTVMNPRDKHDRYVRQQRHVWIRPDAIPFHDLGPRGLRRQSRNTWTLEQGANGRRAALAARLAAQQVLE